jgi:hypothetical protein
MQMYKSMIGAVLAVTSLLALAQQKQETIQCYSITSPKACEHINKNHDQLIRAFNKTFPADYAVYVNAATGRARYPAKYGTLHGVVEIVRVTNPNRKKGEIIQWSPVYAFPFERAEATDETAWTVDEAVDGTSHQVLHVLFPKLERGELKP